ncbi:hypothetical protein AMTR_s00062p00106870 [Amborella trichopoda]|uniref:Uncharacterized protein n=1 Tax=Amborella trichopoda TaxID=13333 RepID=U5DDT9_AMBTC|nr:hypothetical protein AMTR_s00062p00106870 [Amborella trichopoda]
MLILDDMWDLLDIDRIRVPRPNAQNRCKIIITTRQLAICNLMETDKITKLDVLQKGDAWNLFHQKAGEVVDLPNIEPCAREIVRECSGLPLAIITVGCAMKGKSSVQVWENASRALREASPEIEALWISSSSRNFGKFLVKAGLGLQEAPMVEDWIVVERISLLGNEIKRLPNNPFCSRLETLLLQGNQTLENIPDGLFESMEALQVLNLSFTKLCSLPPSLSNLSNLRFLSLGDCKNLEDIPPLGKLKQLQVLNLRGTGFTRLPQEMGELVNLRHLDLSYTSDLQEIEYGLISRLTNLEELDMYESRYILEMEMVVQNGRSWRA